MERDSAGSESKAWVKYVQSPTVILTLILISSYVAVAALVGNFSNPIGDPKQNFIVLFLLEQCDAPTPIFPWTLLTSIFLHANLLHIASNVAFLVIFGFILEEQIPKSRWITAFLLTGIAGSLTFAAADLAGYYLAGFPSPNSLDCGVGASGAVYGIMGTALGLKVVLLLVFLLGLNVFAGGGTFAHLGGLAAGLLLRRFWSLSQPPKGY